MIGTTRNIIRIVRGIIRKGLTVDYIECYGAALGLLRRRAYRHLLGIELYQQGVKISAVFVWYFPLGSCFLNSKFLFSGQMLARNWHLV